MTSHELAKKLLKLPDYDIYMPIDVKPSTISSIKEVVVIEQGMENAENDIQRQPIIILKEETYEEKVNRLNVSIK